MNWGNMNSSTFRYLDRRMYSIIILIIVGDGNAVWDPILDCTGVCGFYPLVGSSDLAQLEQHFWLIDTYK
ncbi:hypothetical protein XELAEV_18031662mg [Xenopus laevis]|uniref:Uncharacterized protein n=1 Tax=Xenopus laevis TaxID=8355 RepID=A0A974CPN6_XENLA|nr:hypothetical protein XELAEV_18031662mg [Xenopus laevis]